MIIGRDLLTDLGPDKKNSKKLTEGGVGPYGGFLALTVDLSCYEFKILNDRSKIIPK